MSFGLYAVGYFIVLVGVLYIGHLMHIPQNWLVGIGIVMLGLGITSAVTATRRRGPS